MTRTSCLLYLYTHSDCIMTRTSCLLYLYTHSDCRMTRTSCLLYLYTHSDCRMTRTSCLLYLFTHSDCRMTRTSCLLYLYTHSDCRMTRTSCLLYLYTHSDCRMTRTSCLLYLYTHSDCRMTRTSCLLYLYTRTGDCQYVDVECPRKCVQKVQKRNVDTHLVNECPNRDYRCPHCNFANKYHVVSDHFEVCPYYPLTCPNRCGATFECDDLLDHMKMCRLEEVQCVFSGAGCQAKFIRENEDEHMDQNTQKHLALMPAATLRISQKLQEQQEVSEKKMKQQKEEHQQKQEQLGGQLQELLTQIDKQSREFQELMKERDAQIKALEEQQIRNRQLIEQQQQAISQICSGEFGIPPYDITLSNYQEKARGSHIDGPPMYTHPGGYKFNLRLYPKGVPYTEAHGTHVSVLVYPLKGDHDAKLKFPVKLTIIVQLLNQHWDQEHHTRDIQCEIKTRERIGSGLSIGFNQKFIPRADLEWNRDKQTQYLKDDCLRLLYINYF